MKQRVYIETTIVSYYTSRPSRDMVIAAHQELTRQWWDFRSNAFEIFVYELVLEESGRGDPRAADKRSKTLQDIAILTIQENAADLAEQIIRSGSIPSNSAADALRSLGSRTEHEETQGSKVDRRITGQMVCSPNGITFAQSDVCQELV